MKEKVAAAMADKYWRDILIRHRVASHGRAPGSRGLSAPAITTLTAPPDPTKFS